MAIRQYIGARYVPKLCGEWEANTEYEALSVVSVNGTSYTSKIPVPDTVGSPADNPDYWVKTGDFNLQLQHVEDLVSGFSEDISAIEEVIEDGKLKVFSDTTKCVSTIPSYVGFVNTGFMGDNGTRLYILPKGPVTNGTGGCLKIFADDYQNDADYRDLGIYFSANQNGDTGYNNTGVDWINVKVLDNGQYAGKHPDLGFSFQDGHVVAGRITCFNNSRAVWCFGGSTPKVMNRALIAEFQNDIGMCAGSRIILLDNDSEGTGESIWADNGTLKGSAYNGAELFVGGNAVASADSAGIRAKSVIPTGRLNVTTNVSSINVAGYNLVVLVPPASGMVISSINGGVEGQEITIAGIQYNPTIQNNTSIHLRGGNNCTLGNNETLTLIRIGSAWYEKCRSAA